MVEKITHGVLLQRCKTLCSRIPLKLMIISVVIGLIAHDWFPFSEFRMYAAPGETSSYVYVTDGDDQVIRVQAVSNMSVARLKKVFKSNLKAVCREIGGSSKDPGVVRAAGERTLNQLIRMQARSFHERKMEIDLSHLKLWNVDIRLEDNRRLAKSLSLIAEVGGQ